MDNTIFPVLGTGLSGLVGSRCADLLKNKYSFTNLDLTVGVDITNESQVMQAVESSQSDVIIHMAAFVDPNRAWQERGNKDGICYRVNVTGTENIAKAAKECNKHLIHISTAYVFDGEKDTLYTEEDTPHPIEWYGETKALAETVVQETAGSWTIFRIDQPFRSDNFTQKQDTTRKLVQGLQDGTLYPQFTDHWFSPTIIEDFANVLDWAITTKPQEIYHATSGVKVSDFEYANMIKDALHLDTEVKQGSLAAYLTTLQRPYQRNTAMSSEKLISASKISFTPLAEAIARLEM